MTIFLICFVGVIKNIGSSTSHKKNSVNPRFCHSEPILIRLSMNANIIHEGTYFY